jgi:hypothetical protein
MGTCARAGVRGRFGRRAASCRRSSRVFSQRNLHATTSRTLGTHNALRSSLRIDDLLSRFPGYLELLRGNVGDRDKSSAGAGNDPAG